MVLAACLVVLSLSSYRVADLETLLHDGPERSVTTAATADGRAFLVSVLDPAQRTIRDTQSATVGETKKAPASAFAVADTDLVGPPLPPNAVTIAAAAPATTPHQAAATTPLATTLAAQDTSKHSKRPGLLLVDELVGPPRPSPRDLAFAAAMASTKVEMELVGPPAPTAADLALAAVASAGARSAVGPRTDATVVAADAKASRPVAASETEVVGPPLPADWHPGGNVVLAAAMHPPLTFEHLAVGPFRPHPPLATPAPSPATTAVEQPGEFEEFLASVEDGGGAMRAMRHRFRWGETMSQVLGKAGVDQAEVDEWIRATNEAHDVDRVYAGQELELMMAKAGSDLQRLRMEIDPQTVLVVERQGSSVVARKEEIPYDRALRVVGSGIRSSLYETAQSHGIPDKIISDMAEILGWDVDLATDLEPGATFRVVYEELTRPDTMETMPGRLLAVDLANRGKRHEGYFFTMPDGKHAGYYDRTGKGIGRGGFLRFPVAYSRISSNFSTARFHPILKRSVPHYGVDFAAPPGTPVKAVADGRVLKAGWYGGNGKFVKIQHDKVYETGYSHLSSIAPGVRAGGSVKQGQVIGYVGSTGLATGPHLHFAMYRSGKYVDPLKADLPRSQSLAGRDLAAFRMRVDMMDRTYVNAGHDRVPTQMAADFAPPVSSGGGGQ
jgi:murein DD-endopeptidase MepM/ murein hydrolase activator NlpD